jgi:hypothetical protein
VKSLTREQLQSRKDKAVRFVRDILDDPDRVAEIEDEDLEDYAERRKIELINSGSSRSMANGGNNRTKQELLDEIDELQQENQDLQDQLDAIADIVSPPEEEDEEDDGDDDDERPDVAGLRKGSKLKSASTIIIDTNCTTKQFTAEEFRKGADELQFRWCCCLLACSGAIGCTRFTYACTRGVYSESWPGWPLAIA